MSIVGNLPMPSAGASASSAASSAPQNNSTPTTASTNTQRDAPQPRGALSAGRLPMRMAGIQDGLPPALRLAIPDAAVFGETHSVPGAMGRGGNFGLIDTSTGETTYFGTKPFTTVNLGPLGTASVSVVGTNNGRGDEAGLGLTWKLPTPAGDLLVFANIRQDGATVGNLMDAIQGKGQKTFTASVNLGGCYSLSDGAATMLSNAAIPGSGIAAARALELIGADAWVGAAYRGTITFERGQLKSVNISGVEIPAARLGEILGGRLQGTR